MQKTHYSILPIFAVFFSLFCVWSTSFAQATERIMNQLIAVDNLPAGSVFQITLTDEDATEAASEYLIQYEEDIQNMIQHAAGIKLDFSDPKIDFDEDRLVVSIRGGLGFLKVTASAGGTVLWDEQAQQLIVNVDSVDIPIISVDPATINAYIQAPMNDFIHGMMEGYEVISFKVYDGFAVLEAMKK